jgi:hypothetical protein
VPKAKTSRNNISILPLIINVLRTLTLAPNLRCCVFLFCFFFPSLLTRSQFASGRSWDRPTRSRISMVFLGPKFHVALYASHAALQMVTLKISPYTNVTLTFDFDFGLDHPVHGGYGWGSPTPRRWSNCQTKKLKSGYGPHWRPGTKTNWPTDCRSQCNLKLNLCHCTANYRPVLSSERAPYMKIKNVIVTQINVTSGYLLQKGQDTKTPADWLSVVMWLWLIKQFYCVYS